MKKLTLPLLVLTLACSKSNPLEKTYCWKCIYTQKTTVSPSIAGYPQTTSSTTTPCDLTESQARDVENAAKSTASSTAGGYTATVTTTMVCTKQ